MEETKPTVLCIDDDSFTLAHIKECLSSRYNLIFAIDPDVGFELAVRKQPNLILLDVNMPNMNGFELADMTSRLSVTKDIPVIFLTSHASKEIQQEAESLGAAAFIRKPFSPEQLIGSINDIFERMSRASG